MVVNSVLSTPKTLWRDFYEEDGEEAESSEEARQQADPPADVGDGRRGRQDSQAHEGFLAPGLLVSAPGHQELHRHI